MALIIFLAALSLLLYTLNYYVARSFSLFVVIAFLTYLALGLVLSMHSLLPRLYKAWPWKAVQDSR